MALAWQAGAMIHVADLWRGFSWRVAKASKPRSQVREDDLCLSYLSKVLVEPCLGHLHRCNAGCLFREAQEEVAILRKYGLTPYMGFAGVHLRRLPPLLLRGVMTWRL